jgi:hypothetical protein
MRIKPYRVDRRRNCVLMPTRNSTAARYAVVRTYSSAVSDCSEPSWKSRSPPFFPAVRVLRSVVGTAAWLVDPGARRDSGRSSRSPSTHGWVRVLRHIATTAASPSSHESLLRLVWLLHCTHAASVFAPPAGFEPATHGLGSRGSNPAKRQVRSASRPRPRRQNLAHTLLSASRSARAEQSRMEDRCRACP